MGAGEGNPGLGWPRKTRGAPRLPTAPSDVNVIVGYDAGAVDYVFSR
jgi:hypothetical protein